jgi:hypothetical protein
MKLRLSTLVVILIVIFMGYCYLSKMDPPKSEKEPEIVDMSNGVTPLAIENNIHENFAITPLDLDYDNLDYEQYDDYQDYEQPGTTSLAGNIRPDNVQIFE